MDTFYFWNFFLYRLVYEKTKEVNKLISVTYESRSEIRFFLDSNFSKINPQHSINK